MNEETQLKIVKEVVVLKKFYGNDQTGEPFETITIENGLVISHEVNN